MHTDLTVRETLMFQAMLRLPPSWNRKRTVQIVTSTIAMLELEHIQNSIIGMVTTRLPTHSLCHRIVDCTLRTVQMRIAIRGRLDWV